MPPRAVPEVVTAAEARRVLLTLQGLGAPPTRSGPAVVQRLVESLGYVQIDSINVIERAQHLTLGARLDGYKREHLAHALEKSRGLFEHWTHDACAIPTKWYAHWKHRFARYHARVQRSAWWKQQLGPDPEGTIRATLARVRRTGPMRARDFEKPDDHRSEGWWEWHPEKAALEHLWRQGKLAIARRERFEKVYDLPQRVYPEPHGARRTSTTAHVDWACREAIARIGIATPIEMARFFCAVSPAVARAWCAGAVRRGELVDVFVDPATRSGKRVRAVALPDWRTHCKPHDSATLRILAPFDPVVRDRARAERLFGISYRFEAFVPAPKRVYGYYTLPLLEGDRLVGLIDPKLDREAGEVLVRGPWWFDDAAATRRRDRALAVAIDRLAQQVGASQWSFSGAPAHA